MDLEELKYIGEDAEICWVLDNLTIKYDAYIEKFPNKELPEQKAIISILRVYRERSLEMYQNDMKANEKYLRLANKTSILYDKYNDCKKKIVKLELENKRLKDGL